MKCPKCGKTNVDGALFCVYCHSLFKNGGSPARPSSGRPIVQSRPQVQSKPQVQSRPQVQNRPQTARKKDKNKALILVLALCSLALVMLVTGLMLYNSGVFSSSRRRGGGGGGGGGIYDSEDNVIIKQKADIRLTASETELRTDSGSHVIYFYAEYDAQVDSLELVDPEGNMVTKLLDDGKRNESGDETRGDGVYTAALEFDTFDESAYYFSAVNAGHSRSSDLIKIAVISPLTSEELENNRLVDEVLVYILTHPEYASMTTGQKSEFIMQSVNELASMDLIRPESIHMNAERCLITFYYASGIMGGISYADYLESENALPSRSQISASALSSTNARDFSDSYDAVLIYATDNLDSPRYPVVSALAEDWTRRGLSTRLVTDATIDTMKHLGGLDFICFDAHGLFFEVLHQPNDFLKWFARRNSSSNDRINTPALFLNETPTPEKDRMYSNDLKTGRVIKLNGGYAITSAFFDYYYDDTQLKDTIIYFCCCELMGAGDVEEETWSNVLLSKDVAAFVAYHNTVFSFYVYDMLSTFVPDLIQGLNVNDALEHAKELFGDNDGEWVEIQEMPFSPHVYKAYPVLRGNKKATLSSLY